MASAAMSAYVGGQRGADLAQNRTFLMVGSFFLLFVAVVLNIIGLNIGKWLQNAGGVGTYLPPLMLRGVAVYLWRTHGSVTHFTWSNMMPRWNWDTVNFWPQIAFAFGGLELASAMSEEMRDPRQTFPRAIFGSGVSIAVIYIVGTIAVLAAAAATGGSEERRVSGADDRARRCCGSDFWDVVAALLVSVGNAGGIGTTVAGVSRVPFVVGIDRYLPAAFGKIHPNWKTPWVSILVQAGVSGVDSAADSGQRNGEQRLPDSGGCDDDSLFHSVRLHVCGGDQACVPQGSRRDPNAVLIPGGKFGVWIAVAGIPGGARGTLRCR